MATSKDIQGAKKHAADMAKGIQAARIRKFARKAPAPADINSVPNPQATGKDYRYATK